MKRHFVAFGLLAAALSVVPVPSPADAAGFRSGGFGGARFGGFRPIPRLHALPRRPYLAMPPLGTSPHPGPVGPGHPVFKPVKIPPVAASAFTWRGSRLVRLDHVRHRRGGLALPITGYGDFGYFGAPYDPSDAIPVYAPQPLIQQVDDEQPATPRPPVLTRARGADQDACSAEKVTVPASEGEREITVVRC